MRSIIQIHLDNQWVPAAEFEPMGREPYTATFEYLIDYVFGSNPLPVSLALPVTAQRLGLDAEGNVPPCPPFLLDLVPQGRGRRFLAQELGMAEGDAADLPLAQYGAFNPVGNLRLDSAVQFYQEYRQRTPDNAGEGYSLEDILSRREAFLDHLWLHGMMAAGTTGVQGAAPKFLLTQNRDGLWFADAALADEEAAHHWLVKLPRGSHETDYAVLRNEAAYLCVAARCGLRVEGEPMWRNDMLFLPRFDRKVAASGLIRRHQESLASLAGIRGFGVPVSLFTQVAALAAHVSDPDSEIIEFLKRDILNLALRNSDNHARNSAVQRLEDGSVRLTPLFDFAPMYLDRELIVRTCRWRDEEGREIAEWDDILGKLPLADANRVTRELKAFSTQVAALPETLRDCGVDAAVIEDCRPTIAAQHQRLDRITP